MASKPGLSNVLNIKPTSSLRYTKYFPNNLEYASKVYPDKKKRTKHREADTQTEDEVVISKCADALIVDEKHLIATCSPTEMVEVLEAYTQTDDTAIVEIAIQTEETNVHYGVSVETLHIQNFEETARLRGKKKKRRKAQERSTKQTSDKPQPGSSSDNPDLYNELHDIWIKMKTFGEPRVVVSVIGAYNEQTSTYEWADNSLLKEALNDVARFAGRCGFIYKEKETIFVDSVVKKCIPIGDLPHTYGYSFVHIVDHGKEQGTELVKENEKQSTGEQKQRQKIVISIFDLKEDAYPKLWERITDGILRSWSLEEKDDDDLKNGGGHISKYVVNIDGLTRKELFYGYQLNPDNISENTTKKENTLLDNSNLQNTFVISFLGGTTATIKDILTKFRYFYLSEENFKEIWKQEITSKSNTPIIRLFKDVYPGDLKDSKAVKRISGKLLKGLCFSKIGMLTCCRRWGKKCNACTACTGRQMPTVGNLIAAIHSKSRLPDTLRLAVLLNKKDIAAVIWHTCSNPMMTALISSIYLTALADVAEDLFEENLQEEYQYHAKLFLSRAIKLLDKMFTENERIAVDALEYVSDVWDYIESPLHLGHQFNIEEFISHSSIQIDATRRLFPINKDTKISTDATASQKAPETNASTDATVSNKAPETNAATDTTASHQAPETNASKYTTASQTAPETNASTDASASQTARESNASTDATASQSAPETNDSTDATASQKAPTTNASTDITASKKAPEANASTDASQITQDNTTTNDNETQNTGNTSDDSTEKNDASQNIPSNNIANNLASTYQELLLDTKTYPITVKGCFSFVKDNWGTSKRAICTAPFMKIIFHVVCFLTTLVMFSYFLTGNLEVDSISLLEGLVFIYMLGDLLEEMTGMIRLEKDCIWSFHQFNFWNFLDILCSTLYILGFSLHVFYSNSIVHTRRIYSIALFIMFLRLLNLLLLSKTFGIIIIMLKEMLVDLLKYLFILIILVLAAGVVYHANVYPNHQVTGLSNIAFWRIWTIIKIPYWQVYGELFLDTLEASDSSSCTNNATLWKADPSVERCPTGDWITPVIAAFYMMLTNWLLLNIVIAMFGARFNVIQRKSKQKWRYYRHSVIFDYEDKIPSPLNFPFRIYTYLRYSQQIPCACCPCFDESKKGGIEKMLEKQLEFAKDIIEKENHQKSQ